MLKNTKTLWSIIITGIVLSNALTHPPTSISQAMKQKGIEFSEHVHSVQTNKQTKRKSKDTLNDINKIYSKRRHENNNWILKDNFCASKNQREEKELRSEPRIPPSNNFISKGIQKWIKWTCFRFIVMLSAFTGSLKRNKKKQ